MKSITQFHTIFSKIQCRFRKGFNAQHCLLLMPEKWRKTLDGGLTDLSQAFDCTDHDLLIAKLIAYSFEKQSIDLIYSYFTKRKQRTKVDSAVSSREMLFSGVPQGSVSEPLFSIYLYIYICDIFYENPNKYCSF